MKRQQVTNKRVRKAPLTVGRRELLVRGSDEMFRNFIHDFLAFSERVMAVRAGFGELSGITGIQYTVLVSIAHLQAHGPVSINMVANHLHFSGAFITTVTKQLEQQGLILKNRDSSDQRRAALMTTTRADELLDRLAPVQRQVNDKLFEKLTHEEFQQLAGWMNALVECGDNAISLLEYLKQTSASERWADRLLVPVFGLVLRPLSAMNTVWMSRTSIQGAL